MMVQRELWATEAEPKVLRASVERLWTEGDEVYSLSLAVVGTRSAEAVWMTTQRLEGPQALPVASAIVAAALARFDGSNWRTVPKQQPQAKWERHLHTY